MADFTGFGSLAPSRIDDRQNEVLSPADQARMIMGDVDETPPDPREVEGRIKAAGVTQLGIDAGLLQIHPAYAKIMLQNALKKAQEIQADPTIHSFDEPLDPNGPPVRLDRRKQW